MANIKLRRGSGVPSGLTFGEPAFDITNSRLYVGITGGSALVGVAGGGVHSFNGLTGAVTGVSTFNGFTGAVTGVTTGVTNTFGPIQNFTNGISASGGSTFTTLRAGTFTVGDTVNARITTTPTNIQGYYQAEANPRFEIGRDTVSSGQAGIAFNDTSGTIAAAGGAVGVPTTRTLGLYTSNGSALTQRVRIDPDGQTNILHPLNAIAGLCAAGSTFTAITRFTVGISALGGTFTNDIIVNGVLVGEGGGSISTNVAVGQNALNANTTGSQSVAIGTDAATTGVTVTNITAVGYRSLYLNRADNNTSVGNSSLIANTTGTQNVSIGTSALFSNTTGSFNVGMGHGALNSQIDSTENIAVGRLTLQNLSSGSQNTAIGSQAGRYFGSGTTSATNISNSILIGYDARPSGNTESNQIVIGYQGRGDGSNTTVIGNSSTTSTRVFGQLSTNGGLSAAGATFSANIRAPNIVNSVNGLTGGVTFYQGSNITLTTSAAGITIASTASSSGLTMYVESFNGLTGAVTGVTTGTVNTFGLVQNFTSGISASGITVGVARIIGTSLRGGNGFTIRGSTLGSVAHNEIDLPAVANSVTISSATGVINFDSGLASKTVDYSTGIRLLGYNSGLASPTSTTLVVGGGAGNTVSMPQVSGTLALVGSVVTSFNGLTGSVTGVTTGTANTFGPLQSFTNGISSAGGTFGALTRFTSGICASGGVTLSGTLSGFTATFNGLIISTAGFSGTGITLSGNLSAATKSFLIPHPIQPNKKLQYACLEGPENGVYVRGRLTGSNVIDLPDYWTALVHSDSITVQLTANGSQKNYFVKSIEENRIIVGSKSKEIDCFYLVQGERKDVPKLTVEY